MRKQSRLLEDVIDAFVDRMQIEWRLVLTRVTGTPDSVTMHAIRALELLRGSTSSVHPSARGASTVLLTAIATFAAVQMLACLGLFALVAVTRGVESNRAPQVLLACSFAAAAMLLGAYEQRDHRRLPLLAWFTVAASAFARHALSALPASVGHRLDPLMLGFALEAFLPACLWHFSLHFPDVTRFTRFDRVARWATGAMWVLGGVLFGLDVALAQGWTANTLLFVMRERPSSIFWHVVTLSSIPPVLALLVRARRAPAIERKRVARLATALAVGTGPFLLMGIVMATSPHANVWRLAGTPARFWLDIIVIAGFAATPLLVAIAIVLDRPFGTRPGQFARAAFAVARLAIRSIAIAPLSLFVALLYRQRHLSVAELFWSPAIAPLVACAIVAYATWVARVPLLTTFDRFVSRRAVAHRAQFTRALERVRMARGVRETIAVLSTELARGIGAESVTVLERRADGRFAAPGTAPLSMNSALMAVLQETTRPLDVSDSEELFGLLPAAERDWLTGHRFELLMPVKHPDGDIAAIVACGHKRAGLPFDTRDEWLVESLTTAASTAWSDAKATAGDDHDEVALECPLCGILGTTALPCDCATSPILAALPLKLGDRFIVQRRLGAGGMGVVYLARDSRLDRRVALKTLPERTADSVHRLRDEARAMAALNHEALATIYGLEVWQHTPVLVVEYLANGTLADRLARGPLRRDDAVRLGIALTRALVYMHANGVLHRDLKPSNVGFTATGAPKLLDFGLASLVDSRAPRSAASGHLPAGTTAYLPPEAMAGATAGPGFDLWALSVVMLEAMTGARPRDRAAELRSAAATLDADLATFFARTLDPDPRRRFQAASTFLTALEALS